MNQTARTVSRAGTRIHVTSKIHLGIYSYTRRLAWTAPHQKKYTIYMDPPRACTLQLGRWGDRTRRAAHDLPSHGLWRIPGLGRVCGPFSHMHHGTPQSSLGHTGARRHVASPTPRLLGHAQALRKRARSARRCSCIVTHLGRVVAAVFAGPPADAPAAAALRAVRAHLAGRARRAAGRPCSAAVGTAPVRSAV